MPMASRVVGALGVADRNETHVLMHERVELAGGFGPWAVQRVDDRRTPACQCAHGGADDARMVVDDVEAIAFEICAERVRGLEPDVTEQRRIGRRREGRRQGGLGL